MKIRIMNIVATFSILALSTFMVHAEVIVDVTKIAGKSQGDVAAYLGKEISCGKNKYGEKCQYKKEQRK